MKIATWNVNSIRTRLDHVVQWLTENPVDVLCVQETKVEDTDFPRSPLEALGYQTYISGQKSYNGVALISRTPLQEVRMGFAPILGETIADLDIQKRVITGMLEGVCVVNLYVPNGSEVGSEKYQYKLRWLSVLRDYLKAFLTEHPDLLVCGDFNIAPDDRDIHDPTGRENRVMASDAERQALEKAVFAQGLIDAFRKFNQEAGQFTWWDYRAAAFRRNLGWRIDHHYLSPGLYDRAKDCVIDRQPRGWEKPSDHVPVIVEIE
ncbi:MAG: exodeoxyribonuclease III [Cyanobacteria bacterium CRU_2_1]|nr:exodeoxyribonuclease III [Cyanobacteria bacterium RU_5_0]NJR59701.1 exodeoxyribonuclease III [Cyanobacteria bacterium CRU_2_1]